MSRLVYEGIEVDVPIWANFIAGDGDGDVHFYYALPCEAGTPGGYHYWKADYLMCQLVEGVKLKNRRYNYPLMRIVR